MQLPKLSKRFQSGTVKNFLIIALISAFLPGYSQNQLKGTITDAKSGEALPGATVYIINTSLGNISDLNGDFKLNTGKYKQFTIFVSYIGYQTVQKKIDLEKTKFISIKLLEKTTQLDEVTVTSNKDKTWKRNFKKFRKAFLGNSAFAKNCQILNPWVLEFSKDGTALKASASEILEIKNNSLGYKVYYLLNDFTLDVNQLSFGGKSSFLEMDTTSSLIRERWKNNRKKAFYGSRNHFFQALLADKLEEEGFEIFESRQTADHFVATKRLSRKSILSSTEDGSNQVVFKNFLNVVYRKASLPEAYLDDPMFALRESKSENLTLPKQKFVRNNLNNSFGYVNENVSQSSLLYLRTSSITLDKSGLLSSDVYLNEFGYWAWLRVGDMIPANYVPDDLNLTIENNPEPEVIEEIPTKKEFILSNLLIPLDEIKSGGVSKDAIPAISSPNYLSIDEVDFLRTEDLVISVTQSGVTKAYPIKILNYHEIVNEENYLVTYCPLCYSGVVFNNKVDGNSLNFGVSGLLYFSDILMYDFKTNSLWSQLESKAISGDLSGKELDIIPSFMSTWSAWKKRYPDGLVLSTETGYEREYNTNPYQEYESNDATMFPISKENGLMAKKDLVLGITINNESRAYPIKILKKRVFVQDSLGDKSISIKYDPNTKSAEVQDAQRNAVPATVMYWFAWYAFNSETSIFKE